MKSPDPFKLDFTSGKKIFAFYDSLLAVLYKVVKGGEPLTMEGLRSHKKIIVYRPLKIGKVMRACDLIIIFYLFYKVKLRILKQE